MQAIGRYIHFPSNEESGSEKMNNDMKDLESKGNSFWNDETLSWKAKGVMGYIVLSLEEKDCNIKNKLLLSSRDGEKATMSAVNELISRGYIRRHQERSNGKFLNAKFIIVDMKSRNILQSGACHEQCHN